MAPTKSNPRRILRGNGELSITATDLPPTIPESPKRDGERLETQRRKDDIVSKMAEIFEDVAPMEPTSVVAVPVEEDEIQAAAVQDEPLPDITLMPVARTEPAPILPDMAVAGPSGGDGELIFTEPFTSVPLLKSENRERAPVPVDLRPPVRVLEQGEILLSDDPEQVRVLIEHNIKLKGTITDEMLEKVNRLLEHISADKCHCCGESIETAHKGGEFLCDVPDCLKTFRLKSSVDRHKRVIHHQGDVHQCPECGARCADKGTLARHMYTHTGLKPYTCEMCNKHFSRKYHLDRHVMQTGCDGKPKAAYPCQVCGKMFTRKDNLREHLRAHAGQVRRKKCYTCHYCEKQFYGSTLLQVHLRTHTGEKPYQCDFCDKHFPSIGSYKKHRRIHTGEKPYECKHCGARFSAKETLNRHVRTHTGVKPHSCQYCGKSFIQASQLKSHIFHHTGQGGFQCPHCDRSFNRKARLKTHVEYVHEGKKAFQCETCDKTFVRKEDLARHSVLHQGKKSHRCPICDKTFAIKPSLKIHLLTHTKEPPRSCEECGRAFIRQDCLIRHMRKKHRPMLDQIMAEAEKKKIQQQLNCTLDAGAGRRDATYVDELESTRTVKGALSDRALGEALGELLTLLVDEATLEAFGHPEQPVEHVLESVIRRCGHAHIDDPTLSYPDRLRENAKLLFTVVIDDNAVKTLLNSQTVDEVILHVLKLARS